MKRIVGVEAAHGFGDGLFSAALIREFSKYFETKIGVAVRPHCADAFENLPWVNEIIHIQSMGNGYNALREKGYRSCYQITQNIKFFEFQQKDPNHSLIDTPLLTGLELGLPKFDQRPVFIPTPHELRVREALRSDIPTIAIESVHTSGQSWADRGTMDAILEKYLPTHRILWLSNTNAPDHPNVHKLLQYTRREIITTLALCETFFSVGSGFFCSTLALPKEEQPRRVVCMWIDDLYKYKHRLSELQWHDNIIWVRTPEELQATLGR